MIPSMHVRHTNFNTADSRPSASFVTQVDHMFSPNKIDYGNIHKNEKVTFKNNIEMTFNKYRSEVLQKSAKAFRRARIKVKC